MMGTRKRNCWEIKKCGRQPGGPMVAEHGVCPAAADASFDGINSGACGGRFCWAVAGTFCGGEVQGTFAQKRGACLKCSFYHRVRAEEGTANLRTKFLRLAFSSCDKPLFHAMTTRKVPAGERLFSQGESADETFIIQRGTCLLLVEKDGELHPTDHRSEGDLVGMTSVLTDEPRSAHAEAETDMEVWRLPRTQLDKLFRQDPDLRDFLTELVAERFDSRRPVADRTIGQYTATDIIGRGGFSIVYKGVQAGRDTPVAIKMLRHDMAMNPDFMNNFRNEARIIADLDHANILKLYDIEERFHTRFIITEYLEGEALDARLRKMHRFPADLAARYLLQICRGLQYAHTRGIIHRDINATNVIVQPDGNLKILDFGLACPIGTEDLDFGGALFYMSPEQIEGDPLDQRTDIYSLGILAYEMVVGRRPFPEDDLSLLMKLHCEQEIPDPRDALPDMPPAMAELIRRACRRNPQERFQSIDAMLGPVAALAESALPPAPARQREGDLDRPPGRPLNFKRCETKALTHRGLVRNVNEDRHLVKRLDDQELLMAVADGMGGAPGGSDASETMRQTLFDWPAAGRHPEQELAGLVIKTSQAIWRQVEQNPALEGMGTTVTATLLADGTAYWVHVGDSRFYVFRRDRLIQVTTDQTMAQLLVEEGRITPDEARTHPYGQLLDQCVGCPSCEPETGSIRVNSGDLLLHTTDGLHDALSEQDLTQLLAAPGTTMANKAESLLQAALASGGKDNITLVMVQV